MGLKRLAAIVDVDLELDYRIDFSTLEKAQHFAREELAAQGGLAEICQIPIGRHTATPEDPGEEVREYLSTLLIVRDKTRPLAAPTMYLHASRCDRLSDDVIQSRWDEHHAIP